MHSSDTVRKLVDPEPNLRNITTVTVVKKAWATEYVKTEEINAPVRRNTPPALAGSIVSIPDRHDRADRKPDGNPGYLYEHRLVAEHSRPKT